jgi:hypothetical protein
MLWIPRSPLFIVAGFISSLFDIQTLPDPSSRTSDQDLVVLDDVLAGSIEYHFISLLQFYVIELSFLRKQEGVLFHSHFRFVE